jgi:hypothetical protein
MIRKIKLQKKLEDNLIVNIENSVVVTTIYFWTDCGRNIYWFHWTLHEKGLFCSTLQESKSCKTYNMSVTFIKWLEK